MDVPKNVAGTIILWPTQKSLCKFANISGKKKICITFILGDMKKEGLYIDDNVYSTS